MTSYDPFLGDIVINYLFVISTRLLQKIAGQRAHTSTQRDHSEKLPELMRYKEGHLPKAPFWQ